MQSPNRNLAASRRCLQAVLLVVLASGCAALPKWLFHLPPSSGKPFPKMQFAAPDSADARAYLGLPDGVKTFSFDDIQAEVLILEIVDMYCHVCHKVAKDANTMHADIAARGLSDRVKMAALAVKCSEFEANVFKEETGTVFPVLPDPDASRRMLLGRVGTPSFYVIDLTAGDHRILTVTSGAFREGPRGFLKLVLRAAPSLKGNL